MAPQGAEDELEFIIQCIKHGELKVDWVAVDKERGSANKIPGASARQAYKRIMKQYGTKTSPAQGGGAKPGRKRKTPAAAEDSSESSKKMKRDQNQEGCEGETGGEEKA